jgi:methylmalonyl-CoA epimerase
MANIKKINHIGIAVPDIDKALTFWRDALGLELHHIEEVAAQKSKVAFMPVGESEVELVQPTTPDSTVSKYLEKKGAGIHHLCIEVDDCEGKLAELKAKGVRLINETPVVGSGGKKYAFVHPESTQGVLLELYELPK